MDKHEEILVTLIGLVLSLLSSYTTIRYGHSWVFDLGLIVGSILTIAGLYDSLSCRKS